MKRVGLWASGILAGICLAGCSSSPTFLTPSSIISSREAGLYRFLFILSVIVFVLVESLLIYNIIRFRRRPGDDEPPAQVYGNNRMEAVWTGIPLLLVAVIFIFTVNTVKAVSAPQASQDDIKLNVVGHQWWWEFEYPDLGIKTANELHVPVGSVVQIELRSIDVIHSFWVPQLSGKVDAIPGQTNHLWFKADTIGSYHGQCAEFCGLNHANMRIKVVVESQDDYNAWVANQQKPPPPPQTELQRQGQKIYSKEVCSNCHSLGDKKADKEIGPNLTHLMSRSVFAGSTFDLNEANLRRWLQSNQKMKPGNAMSLNPRPNEIDPLIAFLTSLK